MLERFGVELGELGKKLRRQGTGLLDSSTKPVSTSTQTTVTAAPLKQSNSDAALSDKAEKLERVLNLTSKNSKNKKPLDIKEIFDDEFDLQSEKEFAELHASEGWHSPAALDFLRNKLDVYLFKIDSAKQRLAEYNDMKSFDGNISAYINALPKRIIRLEMRANEYRDCLAERNLTLNPTQLDHSVHAMVEDSINDYRSCENFSEAIFICHFQPLLSALSIKELADIIEKFGCNGVIGAAGEELCKIFRMEIQRRIFENKIAIDDTDLFRVSRFFKQHFRDWHIELSLAIVKKTLNMLADGVIEEASPKVLWVIKTVKADGLLHHERIAQHVTTKITQKINENNEDEFSKNVQCVLKCFHENQLAQHGVIASAITNKVIDDMHADKIKEDDPKLIVIKTYLEQKEPRYFQRLDEAILQRLNHKAIAFRKIYGILFHATTRLFETNYLRGKERVLSPALISQIDTDKDRPNFEMVAVAWQLTQLHFRNVSRGNTNLFKAIYKASFELSLYGISNIANVSFFRATPAFKTAVDNLSDQEIEDIVYADRNTRRKIIFNRLD